MKSLSLSFSQKLSFFKSLQQLTQAGFSLRASLRIIQETNTRFLQKVAAHCAVKLDEGHSFSQALDQQKSFYDPVSLSFLRMGEQTGCLDQALQLICLHLEHAQCLRKQRHQALVYPCLVFALLGFTVSVLCETLLPSLLSFISQTKGEFTSMTLLLIFFSTGLSTHGFLLVNTILILSVFLWGIFHFWERGKLFLELCLLMLPYCGPLCLDLSWARFFTVCSLTTQAHLSFLTAFDTASSTLSWLSIQRRLDQTRTFILEGAPLREAFQALPGLHKTTLYWLELIDKTGQLAPTLHQIGRFYQENADKRQKQFIASLEPFCLSLLGGLLILIISGTLLPLYDQLQSIEAFSG